ncbi:MAG: hypothetical protein ACJA2S_001531 [Cyclobacteriaceae bacterium]|jgi:hypothetical protein
MDMFRQVLEHLGDDDFRYDLLGQKMAIVRNPGVFIGFCLSREDVGYLISSINESETLFDAFHIIYK